MEELTQKEKQENEKFKTVACIDCGEMVEVTKFATPAKVRCANCKTIARKKQRQESKRKRQMTTMRENTETKKADGTMTVEEFKALAMANYNTGGDGVIECWDVKDCEEFLVEHGADAKKEAMKVFGIWDDRRKDIESTKF